MNQTERKRRTPEPKTVRTNRDWVMVMIGIGLIIFFLIAGYLGLGNQGESPAQKKKGPVKNPKGLGLMWCPGWGQFSRHGLPAAPPGCEHRATSTTALGPETPGRSGWNDTSQTKEATVPFT